MEKTLREITQHRRNERCYLIEQENEDYLVIYGSKYQEVKAGLLWDSITSFIQGDVGWKFINKRLRASHDDSLLEGDQSIWKNYDKEAENKVINVNRIYIDGTKKVTNPGGE